MNKNASERIFISLGSNQGDRFVHIQRAVFAIGQRIGPLLDRSALYQNAAQGFAGDPFLNACVEVQSNLTPEQILMQLQQIEEQGGRRREGKDYTSRNIDLDLLFYGSRLISTTRLELPHPRLHQRRFVLQPLLDLQAQKFIHPILNKSIEQLAEECPDDSHMEVSKHKLLLRPSEAFSSLDYLAIEGNIGVGKTSLTQRLAGDFEAKLLLERFEDNAFLPSFYKDPQRYAFPLEMSFLADRFQQLQDELPQKSLFDRRVFSDYHLSKSLLFAQVTLQADELKLYKKLYELMQLSLPVPQLYIYLQQSPERLLDNIKKRGRSYEQDIQSDYLKRLDEGYRLFLQQYPHPTLLLDISELDFVEKEEDYQFLVTEIALNLSKK